MIQGRAPRQVADAVRHVLRLDEDLSPLYAQLAQGSCARLGRERRRPLDAQPDRVRGRRQDDLHDQLRLVGDGAHGDRAGRAARRGVRSRPARVPDAGEDGRRRPSGSTATSRAPATAARTCARSRKSVASGEVDLESLAADPELSDDEVAARLLELPGVGPYAAAHVMMLIGRYSRLVLDSWTRPTYARLNGRKAHGRDDRAALPALPRVRGARVLALPDAGLGLGLALEASSSGNDGPRSAAGTVVDVDDVMS